MAKEMNVTCDFIEKQLVCELPKTDDGYVFEN